MFRRCYNVHIMNTTFLIALCLYLLIFIAVAVMDRRQVESFRDYVTAGKKQGSSAVTMTLLATVIGASSTIGVADTVNKIGFPGIWWLLFGSIGLILQSLFLSEKIRATGADTLPDLAGITVGKGAETLLALVIVISWIGVIAGQLAAMNSLLSFALGKSNRMISLIVSLVVILYTMLGGQLSVVRTDRIQLLIILAGMILAFVYLYFVKGNTAAIPVELINESYRPVNWFTQLFVIGGVYFLGPDILSRNFISRNEKTAKRSALMAGLIFAAFALVITMIGMWVRGNITSDELKDSGALMYVIGLLPGWASVLILFALLSAILSSTDTCIINASAIFVKDILKKDSVRLTRITVGVIGILAVILVNIGRGDIMNLLTNAYSIYTPGVIFPLLVAILVSGKRKLRKPVWFAAVIGGGLVGLLNSYFPKFLPGIGVPAAVMPYITLIGMGISLLLALFSIGERKTA